MNFLGLKLWPNNYRIIFLLILLLSGYFLPIGFFVAVAIVGMVLFDYFFEPAVLFFVAEVIFGLPSVEWSPYPFLGTICFMLGVVVLQEVKRVVLIS